MVPTKLVSVLLASTLDYGSLFGANYHRSSILKNILGNITWMSSED